MKKVLLTSLAGILAVSAANAGCVSPYVSLKGGYSTTNIAVKGDSLDFGADFYEIFGESTVSEIKTIADPLDIRVHTNGVWSFNPAVGMKFCFDDVKFATFRLEAEYSLNQNAKKELNILEEYYRYDVSVKMKNFDIMANAYIDFETNSWIKPFISAGLGYGRSTFEIGANQVDLEDGDSFYMLEGVVDNPTWKDNNLIWSVGGGLAFAVTDNISIDAQYRYLDAGSVKLNVDPYGDHLGSVKVKDTMHQFMAGVRYTF